MHCCASCCFHSLLLSENKNVAATGCYISILVNDKDGHGHLKRELWDKNSAFSKNDHQCYMFDAASRTNTQGKYTLMAHTLHTLTRTK